MDACSNLPRKIVLCACQPQHAFAVTDFNGWNRRTLQHGSTTFWIARLLYILCARYSAKVLLASDKVDKTQHTNPALLWAILIVASSRPDSSYSKWIYRFTSSLCLQWVAAHFRQRVHCVSIMCISSNPAWGGCPRDYSTVWSSYLKSVWSRALPF